MITTKNEKIPPRLPYPYDGSGFDFYVAGGDEMDPALGADPVKRGEVSGPFLGKSSQDGGNCCLVYEEESGTKPPRWSSESAVTVIRLLPRLSPELFQRDSPEAGPPMPGRS